MKPGRALIAVLALAVAACGGEHSDDAEINLREGPAIAPFGSRAQTSSEGAQPALRINPAGLAIIKKSEGLRLSAYPLAGQWLIGYGHAGAEPGQTITKADAVALLRQDVHATEEALNGILPPSLNENEYSALVSLAYNLGVSRFTDTLVYRRLMAGDRRGAADAFLYLDSARVDGELRELAWLKARRAKERSLFLTPPGETTES